jgi:hypothetical protein
MRPDINLTNIHSLPWNSLKHLVTVESVRYQKQKLMHEHLIA